MREAIYLLAYTPPDTVLISKIFNKVPLSMVAIFFSVQNTKTGENIPNDHKIH
jgi:hypothetical protein